MRSDLIISFEVRGRRERKTRGGRRDETVETKTRRGGFWTIRAGRTIVWVYGVGVGHGWIRARLTNKSRENWNEGENGGARQTFILHRQIGAAN